MSRKNLNDALLLAGGLIGTQQFRTDLKAYHKAATDASRLLQDLETADVFDYGASNELDRLKRNAAALATLLSMCEDAAAYVKDGIHAIFQAQDAFDTENERRHKEALAREEEYQKRKKQNERQRAKQKAEAEAE